MSRYDDLGRVWDDRSFKAYGHFTDHPWRWAIGLVSAIIALTFVVNALGIVSIYWGAERAKLTEPGRVTQATYGTDNALHNIAYFHDQCNTILSDQQLLRNAESTLEVDERTMAQTTDPLAQSQAGMAVQQDQTALIGAKDSLSNDVRDYDSKSATQTASPFKAANLPYRIEINPATGSLAGSVNCH